MLKKSFLLPAALWVIASVLSSFSLPGEGKLIRFDTKHQRIHDIFTRIEQQTRFTVGYTHSGIDTLSILILPSEEMVLTDLLDYVAGETGLSYQVHAHHILLTGKEESIRQETQAARREDLLEEPVTVRGLVTDSVTGLPLAYTTVCLLDREHTILKAGVTNDKGVFAIETNHRPAAIRISFIGYTTRQEAVDPEEMATWRLSPDGKVLDEVLVTASGASYQVDRSSYMVTAKMREGTSTAAELLNKLHGVRFNPLTNEIFVGTEASILLLVDGLQQSQEYIRHLPPDRIEQIEVVREPTGRYLSEGYSAIINFRLKKDFRGYDLAVQNFLILNTAGNNGKDAVMMEQPAVNFTYSRSKWNVYGSAAMGRSRWNSVMEKEVNYTDLYRIFTVPSSLDDPNNLYKYIGGYAATGVNYQLKPEHTFSLQFEYEGSDDTTEDYQRQERISFDGTNREEMNTYMYNGVKATNYITSFYYKGKVGEKTEIYGDLSYNFYENRIHNLFEQETTGKYKLLNDYRENKNQVVSNLDATHTFSPLFSLNGGYTGSWRRYRSENTTGEMFLNYREIRNKLFSYLSFNIKEHVKVRIGTGLEYLYTDNNKDHSGTWNWQPYLQLNYRPVDFLNINASYVTDIRYPSLYQLSSLQTAIDSLLTQTGNPDLKSALRHTMTARFTFLDRITIAPVFKYTPHRISDYYRMDQGKYYRTFTNIAMNQYILQLTLDQPVGKRLTVSTNVYLYHDYPRLKEEKNKENGLLMNAELEYYHPTWNLGLNVTYSRMLERSLMLQGYQMINMDAWLVGAVKQFPRHNLSISLNWFPPTGWGLRERQEKLVDTSFYRESTSTHMKIYQGILMCRINLRFNSGQVKSSRKESSIDREQREQRSVGF
ncbi:MAG: TonB-dependent receptor [Tannerellaceae bacterium]|nr:TonB-dependent receptor [Tannerellaceae bacterium]